MSGGIIGLQRRLHEAGRIRIGMQVPITSGPNAGKNRPVKLDRFRFTSPNQRAIEAVGALYGGKVEKWDDAPSGEQWEVVTEARDLDVAVLPENMSFSQRWEIWSGGGCKRRCDGEYEELSDRPCLCDPENRACKPYTHLSLMLTRIPGIGQWRLTTKGYYAATEIAGSIEMANILVQAVGRSVLPGRLRVEAKSVKRADDKGEIKTFNFVVPVLDFEVDMGALAIGGQPIAALAASPPPALPEGTSDSSGDGGADVPSGLRPVPSSNEAVPELRDQILGAGEPPATRRANAAPAIAPTGLQPRTAIDAESTDVTPPTAAAVTPPAAKEPPAPARRRRRNAADTAPPAEPQAQPSAPVVTQEKVDQAVDRAKDRTRKAQGATEKAPAQEHSQYLDNGELRITAPQVKHVQTLFGRLDVDYTREQRLIYVRNVLADQAIGSTWDLSVKQANELIDHLKIVVGDEPPAREGDAA